MDTCVHEWEGNGGWVWFGRGLACLFTLPAGALALSALWLRLACAASGFAAYWYSGRRVFIGVLVAEGVLVAAMTAKG